MANLLIDFAPTDTGLNYTDFDLDIINLVGSQQDVTGWTWQESLYIPGTYILTLPENALLDPGGTVWIRPKVGTSPWRKVTIQPTGPSIAEDIISRSNEMSVNLHDDSFMKIANHNKLGCAGWDGSATTPIRAWFVPDDGVTYIPLDKGFEFAGELENWNTLFQLYSSGDSNNWALVKDENNWTGPISDRSVLSGCCTSRNGATGDYVDGWLYIQILESNSNKGGVIRLRISGANCMGCWTYTPEGVPVEYNSGHLLAQDRPMLSYDEADANLASKTDLNNVEAVLKTFTGTLLDYFIGQFTTGGTALDFTAIENFDFTVQTPVSEWPQDGQYICFKVLDIYTGREWEFGRIGYEEIDVEHPDGILKMAVDPGNANPAATHLIFVCCINGGNATGEFAEQTITLTVKSLVGGDPRTVLFRAPRVLPGFEENFILDNSGRLHPFGLPVQQGLLPALTAEQVDTQLSAKHGPTLWTK